MLWALSADPSFVRVGRVTAVFWEGEGTAATALAEFADAAGPWPGLGVDGRPIRIILASSRERFDSLTAGRVPEWGVGAAFPGTNTVVLRLTGDVRQVLRHELAHLALHQAVRRVPLWFDEGYASLAAGEWGRLEALRVNWALLAGRRPSLPQIDADLRGQAAHAGAGYALAMTTVVLLERLGGDRGLEPLLTNLVETRNLDAALRRTHQITLDQFETLWQTEIRKRYGWALFFGSLSMFWTAFGVLIVGLWIWRARRNRARRAALDEGWFVVDEEVDASA